MSLKSDSHEERKKQDKESSNVVETTQKGKRKEKITIHLGYIPLTKETLLTALYILLFIVAFCILSDAIVLVKNSFWVECSLGFFVLSAFSYYYLNSQKKNNKDYEIAKLKQEIRDLEGIRKSDRHIIELLEKETERLTDEIAFYKGINEELKAKMDDISNNSQ